MPVHLLLAAEASELKGRKWPELQREIAAEARTESDPLLRMLIHVAGNDDAMWIRFHPAEEEVECRLDAGGHLVISARTNSAGPGYHAFLVGWLDRLGNRLHVRWRPAEDDKPGDSSGYFEHRDFDRLQARMFTWLCDLSELILGEKMKDATEIRLSWPTNMPTPTKSCFALSSMGEWDRDWFVCLSHIEGQPLQEMMEAYFPWWRQERDALFYANLGRVVARTMVPWHVPVNDYERWCYEIMLKAYGHAKELDSTLVLPATEITEATKLQAASDLDLRPARTGLGVRRRTVHLPVMADWQICVPGYYYVSQEDNGKIDVISFGNHRIEISTLSVRAKDGTPAPAEKLDGLSKEHPPGEKTFRDRHLLGRAHITTHNDEAGEYFQLHGQMVTNGELATMMITFVNPADKDWASETWQSLKHPPVRQPGP